MAAFTPSKVWSGGEIVLAADVQGNLDDLKNYLASLDESALESLGTGPAAWVGVNQLMRGQYDPIINRAHFVSGCFGGHVRSYAGGRFTYASHANTGVVGTNQYAHVPMTTVDIEVRRPMTVLFHWWAVSFMEPDGDTTNTGGKSNFFVYWDTPDNYEGRTRQRFQDELVAGFDADSLEEGVHDNTTVRSQQSRMMGSTSLRHITAPGTYSLGLASSTTKGIAKLQLVAWGVSFEGFYI